jgi:enterochelin esterase family protein
VDAAGGTPLVSDPKAATQRVAFVVHARDFVGTAATPPAVSVVGPFTNSWSAVDSVPLSRLSGTDLFVTELVLPRSGPLPYKFLKNREFAGEFEDVRAHHVIWDDVNRNAAGLFNALVYAELQPAGKGRLTAWRNVRSTVLGDERDVFVYTPAAYDKADCPRLPSLYFHDGNESLTRESFAEAADVYYLGRPQDAAVLVFVGLPTRNVPADVRFAQYSFSPLHPEGTEWPEPRGAQYVSFLKTELVPKVDAAFRTRTAREDRGVAGISLGGLISVYTGFEASDTFSFVGTQSGSLFFPHRGPLDGVDEADMNAMVERAKADPMVPVRFYVDHGSPSDGSACVQDDGGDDCQSNLLFVDALKAKGYEHAHVIEQRGGHDWAFWKKRLPKLLCFYRNTNKATCGL